MSASSPAGIDPRELNIKKISPVKKDSSSYLSHFTSACLCLTSIGTTTAAAALTVNNLQYVPDEELFSGGSKLIWTH